MIRNAYFHFSMMFLFLFAACNSDNNNVIDDSCMDPEAYCYAPEGPSQITLSYPTQSPSLVTKPTLRISGVSSGDVVQLFNDNSCSDNYLINSTTAQSNVAEMTLSQPLDPGSHTFYVQTIRNGYKSRCSSSSSIFLDYVVEECPENYVPVPKNENYPQNNEFCVMKYEARNVNDIATASPIESLYSSVTKIEAHNLCQDLNALHNVTNKYDLISNNEWMIIARNIENLDVNWSNQIIGDGYLSRGWAAYANDNDPWTNSSPSDLSTEDCLYNHSNGCLSSDSELALFKFKRTHQLSNGEIIWDFSGNLSEWVHWGNLNDMYETAPTCSTSSNYVELNLINDEADTFVCVDFTQNDIQPHHLNFTSILGIGKVYGGVNRMMLRGGSYDEGSIAGIYALNLRRSSTYPTSSGVVDNGIGFRCVYRPFSE